MKTPRIRAALSSLAVAASISIAADAYGPVLHEFIPPDDNEDVALALTTAEGDLPAAIETRSGVVRAPDTQRPPGAGEAAYRDSPSIPSIFRPDRDTRRPSLVHYDDPFSPSIAPYKRLRAFDLVGTDYSLRVNDTSLVRVPLGGEARAGEDEFYADLTVDFDGSSTVLIPSVGPGARIVRQHTTPQVPVDFLRDGAENWYAKSAPSVRGRVHIVMQVAIAAAAFGGDFVMPPWNALAPASHLPPGPAKAFAKVATELGLSRALSPTEAVRKMVAYFRAFTPAEDLPRKYDDIYLDLTLAQRGVCRHRAFAFLVTALGLGIPARVVVNEAHAWVEVQGERLWQRIDLGGAAGAIQDNASEGRPAHRPLDDAFEWPASAEKGSGIAAAERGRQSAPPRARSDSARSGAASFSDSDPASASSSASSGSSTAARERAAGDRAEDGTEPGPVDERPRPEVAVKAVDAHVHHGEPIRVSGVVAVDGVGCGQLRVDVSLKRVDAEAKTLIGSLTTDTTGSFEGNLFLPLSLPVGDYEVKVATPGDARCGAAVSR